MWYIVYDGSWTGIFDVGKGAQEAGQENEQSAHETDESPSAVVYFFFFYREINFMGYKINNDYKINNGRCLQGPAHVVTIVLFMLASLRRFVGLRKPFLALSKMATSVPAVLNEEDPLEALRLAVKEQVRVLNAC